MRPDRSVRSSKTTRRLRAVTWPSARVQQTRAVLSSRFNSLRCGLASDRPEADRSYLSEAMRGDRRVQIRPTGATRWHRSDIYHQLLQMSWAQVTLTFIILFLDFN